MKKDESIRTRTDYLHFLSARGSMLGLEQTGYARCDDQAPTETSKEAESELNGENKKKRPTSVQNSLYAARSVEEAYWRQEIEKQSAQQPSTSADASKTQDRRKLYRRKWGNTEDYYDFQTPGITLIYYLHQLEALEKIYSETRYLTLANQAALAAELCLAEAHVKLWFDCRRKLDNLEENRRTRWDNYDFWSHFKRASGDYSDDEE